MLTEIIGAISTVLAICGVILNNRMYKECFYIWFISNLFSAGLHAEIGLWSLFTRDIIFAVLSVEGFVRWSKKDGRD